MFHDGGYYMVGGMHGFWWLFWLVILGVLAFGLWGRRAGRGRHAGDRHGGSHHDTPLELLRRRLANGDITPDEYEQRKALLDRDAPKPP